MQDAAYKSVSALSKIFGIWIFNTFGRIITTGFFVLFPGKILIGMRFYKALFPNKNRLYHFYCVWKQYHSFTHVFIDRHIFENNGDITYTSEGWEHIEEAARNKTGGLILMSHMGNWEVAAHLLKRKGMKALLYMGIKQKEKIERLQKESLSKSGLRVVAVSQDGGSPFDIIDGINYLKEGGFVSLTGDRIWREDQRALNVKFLGHEVALPETPHIFALLSGAPLFIFFAFRKGKKSYHFKISGPKYVTVKTRKQRKEALQKSLQDYANMMEETLKDFPFEWFHFEAFLGKKIDE